MARMVGPAIGTPRIACSGALEFLRGRIQDSKTDPLQPIRGASRDSAWKNQE